MTENSFSPVASRSGNIQGYQFDGETLVLKFKSGAYRYTPDGAEERQILRDFVATAPTEQSSGQFFDQFIKKNPRIKCVKL
ncbi:MAG TPA: hypothetical protein VIL74_09065 [Pyrinomonadaceae bacterium]|jgi:hypothetical protein